MSKQSFLASPEWTKMSDALYKQADKIVHETLADAPDFASMRYGAGVAEGLKLAAQWPDLYLTDEDDKPKSDDPVGTVDVKATEHKFHAQPRQFSGRF